MRIDEILKAAIEDVGLEFETSLDWLTSTNNETTSTSASVSVSATTTDQESSTAAQSQSIGSITPSSSHEETDESDVAANHSFFDALQQLEEHNKKLNFTYEPEIDTKLVENVQNQQQQQQQQQQTPQQTQTIQTPTTTTTTTPVVKYISIDCLKKSPGEIRADLNKLISAANITHTSTSPPIIQHQQQQKVIRMDSPLSAVATVNQRTSSPSSPFKITQVVSSRPPIQQQPTVTTNLPKTTNIVYYDKTNNRFLPIQSSTATTATNTTPKYTSVMHQPSTSNLNIKTTQRSVVTINPRFISTITTPGTQLQPPTSTTIPMISSAPNLLLHRSSSLATVSNNPPQPPTPVVDYSRFVVEQQDEEVIVEEEDELGHAETYANYMPSKLRIGLSHPDPIVETSSLASVEPPDIRYKLKMPKSVYDKGALSALQLESIVYASQKHEEFLPNAHRCGFLIGDGAGVGKGRTIAGIIYENYLLGRKKAVWLSVSNDLKFDAQRDLVDIGSDKIKVHALNKLKYTRISSKKNARIKKGVIFSTYSSLIGESQQKTTKKKYNSRLKQLLHWLGGESFDGVIVFDECHKAKNLVPYGSSKPTKTGLAVLELQERLPNARIIYASATGASEPKNMAYMVRLGLWGPQTPFRDFNDFIQSIEKRGVGAMEILAMDMKLRGMYMARQLSFAGVSFRVEEIPLDEEYIAIYNDSVRLWVEMKERFQEALDLVDPEGSGNKQLKKTVWCQFWSSHQRFFKYLCMACKVPHVVELAQRALIDNKCVVIGLQSTGEARTLDQLDDYGALSGGEFISTARGVLQNLVERHFPSLEHQQQQQTQKGSANGSKNSQRVNDILQRLSTYTNSAAHSNGTKRSKIKSKGSRKYGRHSSVSSSSSLDSDPAVSTGSFNDENDDPLDDEDEDNDDEQSSNFDDDDSDSAAVDDDDFDDDDDDEDDDDDDEDDEDELSSDDSEAKKPDAIVVKTEKTATKVSADNRRKNMTMKKIDDDEDWSLIKTTTAVDSTENAASVSNDGGFESDDSDDLFSITKSVSVQSLITMNNLQQKKRSLLNSDEKREKSSNKKRKTDETTTKKDRRSPPVMDFIPRRAANRPKPTNDHEMREYIYEMKSDLLIAIQRLGRRLPANTLDQLIDMLEGPENVAEMTGRKGRVVQQKNSDETGSTYVYESRNEADVPVELMNVIQKERFMNGDKLIAIISEAASSGISLQANRRCANQYRRVHITLELPWSADRAIQQFGRTHRSNQVHAPEYVFLISELAGEKRFASTVAKRLESLGALTHGDRRATETRDLSRFNIDNKYGRAAVENVLRSICGLEKPQAQWPSSPANFMQEARQALMGVGLITADPVNSSSMSSVHYWPEKDATQINRFLNRLLGCPVTLQNAIFQFFTDVMSAVILEAKRSGRWDLGILDLGCSNGSEENSDQQPSLVETKLFRLVNHDNFDSATKRVIEMHTVMVERGLTWHRALDIYEAARAKGLDAHFYLSNQVKTTNNSQHRVVLLAVSNENNNPNTTSHKTPTTTANKSPCYLIYKPNTGLQTRLETSDSLEKKFTPIGGGIEEARSYWEAHYERSSNECIHKVRLGSCRRSVRCELGLRTRRYYIMAGAVLAVWTRVEQAVEALTGTSQYRLQIIRVKTSDGRKIVGCVIPGQCVRRVSQLLASLSHCDTDETKTTDFVHSVATTATTTPTSDEFVIS